MSERLEDYVCLKRRLTRLQKRGRITRVFLREREGYLLFGLVKFLDLNSVFGVCLFIDEINHGMSSKVT